MWDDKSKNCKRQAASDKMALNNIYLYLYLIRGHKKRERTQ